jgi:hypothetical protein
MNRRKFSVLTRVGLLAFAVGCLVRLFLHASYSDFTAGLLIGLGIVSMIGGLVKQSRGPDLGDGYQNTGRTP